MSPPVLIPGLEGVAGFAGEASGSPVHCMVCGSGHPASRMTPNYQGSHQIASYAGAQGRNPHPLWIRCAARGTGRSVGRNPAQSSEAGSSRTTRVRGAFFAFVPSALFHLRASERFDRPRCGRPGAPVSGAFAFQPTPGIHLTPSFRSPFGIRFHEMCSHDLGRGPGGASESASANETRPP